MALVQHLGTGRRKSAMARVFLRSGKGDITVNGRAFEDYFSSDAARFLGGRGSSRETGLTARTVSRSTSQSIEAAAIKSGMTTMLQDGMLKVIAGETTLEELYRVVG